MALRVCLTLRSGETLHIELPDSMLALGVLGAKPGDIEVRFNQTTLGAGSPDAVLHWARNIVAMLEPKQ